MRIGVLTGGGDAPGSMRSSVRSCARGSPTTGTSSSGSVTAGAASSRGDQPLDIKASRDPAPGRTILGRRGPTRSRSRAGGPDHRELVRWCGRADRDRRRTPSASPQSSTSARVRRGRPKTIDNDLASTTTLRLRHALQIATDAIDGCTRRRIAQADPRARVMGRHAGWIALESGTRAGHGDPHPECLRPRRVWAGAEAGSSVASLPSCRRRGAKPSDGDLLTRHRTDRSPRRLQHRGAGPELRSDRPEARTTVLPTCSAGGADRPTVMATRSA